jgi:phosphoenolpyruvate-protein kinase (PTS system EI component)
MTFAVHGLPVARGIAIGRAVLVVSSRIDVAHYFIKPDEIDTEIDRVRTARNAVADELIKLQASVAQMGPNDAPHELAALLEVHQMLLQDEALSGGVKHWISERLYNAEWALTTQLEIIARQFDEMEDEYLRERKADLEQVVERILHRMKGTAAVLAPSPPRRKRAAHTDDDDDPTAGDGIDVPLVLIAHDLSPADMLQFKKSVFAGFVTDVGADKPLDSKSANKQEHLNPALGLRAIRWSLADPAMFLTQLRAILRAAAHGEIHLLIPMLAHASEIRQTLSLIDFARAELDNRGAVYGHVKLGAMIEIPAAALTLRIFLKHFDFLSIGTNDLIQYTLAIDRADESVAHLYDPAHPAVLKLVADTIDECRRQGKGVSVCGEMAGDVAFTRLLLGLGLRSFSMHPSRILAVKQEVLRADTGKLEAWAKGVLELDDPGAALAG